jgi:Holliday junction resolvase-like predicted endonuclease
VNPLRPATAFPLENAVVRSCLDRSEPKDEQFFQCWKTIRAGTVQRIPNALAIVTGHVAESAVAVLLEERGLIPIAHQVGPGTHGVDLIVFDPVEEAAIAVEVKGTLRAGRLPWLTRREKTQMSREWLDQKDNPTMAEFEFSSEQIYGAVVAVNLSEMVYRAVLTQDFVEYKPVVEASQIGTVDWL